MTIPVAQASYAFVSAGEDLDRFWTELRLQAALQPLHDQSAGGLYRNGCSSCLSGSYYTVFIQRYWNCPRCD